MQPVFTLTFDGIASSVERKPDCDPRQETDVVDDVRLTINSVQLVNFLQNQRYDYPVVIYTPSDAESGHRPLLDVQAVREIHDALSFRKIKCDTAPLGLQVEDAFVMEMVSYFGKLSQSLSARDEPLPARASRAMTIARPCTNCFVVEGSDQKVYQGESAAPMHSMVFIKELSVSKAVIIASVRSTQYMFLSLDAATIELDAVQYANVFSRPQGKVFEALALKFGGDVVYRVGWVLGSLGLIGSPGNLVRNVAEGVRDLIVLPYQGISKGTFFSSVHRAGESFVRHITAGTLQSVSGFASTVGRNLESLSMDETHTRMLRTIHAHDPERLSEGLVTGAAGFGFSLLSAVAGIVDQPLRTFVEAENPTAGRVVSSFGKGVLGILTKPISGALDFVSQTTIGLINSAGLAKVPRPECHVPKLQLSWRYACCMFAIQNGSLMRYSSEFLCWALGVDIRQQVWFSEALMDDRVVAVALSGPALFVVGLSCCGYDVSSSAGGGGRACSAPGKEAPRGEPADRTAQRRMCIIGDPPYTVSDTGSCDVVGIHAVQARRPSYLHPDHGGCLGLGSPGLA
jgi:hypothetical protein